MEISSTYPVNSSNEIALSFSWGHSSSQQGVKVVQEGVCSCRKFQHGLWFREFVFIWYLYLYWKNSTFKFYFKSCFNVPLPKFVFCFYQDSISHLHSIMQSAFSYSDSFCFYLFFVNNFDNYLFSYFCSVQLCLEKCRSVEVSLLLIWLFAVFLSLH